MESLNDDLIQLLRNIGTRLPSLLTILICFIVALVRWKRHPRVSLIAALGLFFLGLEELIFAIAYIWLPRWLIITWGLKEESTYTIFGLTSVIVYTAALGIVILAIFIERPRRAHAS